MDSSDDGRDRSAIYEPNLTPTGEPELSIVADPSPWRWGWMALSGAAAVATVLVAIWAMSTTDQPATSPRAAASTAATMQLEAIVVDVRAASPPQDAPRPVAPSDAAATADVASDTKLAGTPEPTTAAPVRSSAKPPKRHAGARARAASVEKPEADRPAEATPERAVLEKLPVDPDKTPRTEKAQVPLESNPYIYR